MSDPFHVAQTQSDRGISPTSHVKQCPCGNEPCRPGQRNGKACHALEQKLFRARQKERFAQLREAAHKLKLREMKDRITP